MVEGGAALAMVLMMEVAHTAFCALRESCYRLGSTEKRIAAAVYRNGPRRPIFLNTIIF
jgi:hypothetical protein